jgi:hypothetical protein
MATITNSCTVTLEVGLPANVSAMYNRYVHTIRIFSSGQNAESCIKELRKTLDDLSKDLSDIRVS